ncbi:HNH endonuclease, partial [Lactiplantibacillus pentosus]|nr:HNH endonuclease [Lactiplantibacillus pentosus]MCT3297984.1 HNH endonuclease [Lactiplantibacillus pentosus]
MVAFPDHYCQQHYEHEAEYLASRQRWARSNDKQYTHKYNTVTR